MKYDESIILDALKQLRQNEMNFLRTEQATGFPRQTLKRWYKSDLGQKMFKPDLVDLVTDVTGKQVVVDTVKTSRDIANVKQLLIEKIKDVIPTCRDLDSLSKALKIVNDIDSCKRAEIPNLLNNTMNFIQVINANLSKNEQVN